MKIQVAKNAKRNIIFGVVSKIILMTLPFIARSIINFTLGADYLGLNSLFSSIMQVLSLTELGFSSALIFHMYKPIAENDYDRINSILKFYRNAYKVIGFVIVIIGIMLMPLLPEIINGKYPNNINIYILFGIYIFNTSISYLLFGYKQSLLIAFQRDDLNSIINLFVQLGLQISQVMFLCFTKNYYYYVLCLPFFTIINNLWIYVITKRMFPWAKPDGGLDQATMKDIGKLVLGTFVQKFCDISRNSLDSICISAYLGLVLTGIYNNYYVVFSGVNTLMAIIVSSLYGGIGNHVATKNIEDNFEELKRLDFLYMSISGVCTTCLLCLYQPFMKIWMGEDLCLSFSAVVLFCVYFYILRMNDMKYLYNAATGLWWKLKWRAIVESVVNVALNVIFGKFFGVNGIIFATIISMFTFCYFWGALILFDEYFRRESFIAYLKYHFKYALVAVFVCVVTYYCVYCTINIEVKIIDFICKGVLTVLFSSMLYYLMFFKTKIFKDSINMMRKK